MNDMILVAEGSFNRGSKLFGNELPVKNVFLDSYWIDKYPVTNQRYARFISSGGYGNPDFWTERGWEFCTRLNLQAPLYWNDHRWNGALKPVTGVSWWEAMAFARFEGKQLPTEAQWEKAAGGGERIYAWGDSPPSSDKANFAPGCEPALLMRSSTNVDAFPNSVSHAGCYDMSGNVYEWCLDNVSHNYEWDSHSKNPIYLEEELLAHIVKGGSGLHDEDCLRCASRDYYSPELRDNIVGFRCVRNIENE